MYTPLKSQTSPHSNTHSQCQAYHCSAYSNMAWSKGLEFEHLDLSKLENFEVVKDQYQEQGVQFTNAIALHPSNPAFPTRSSQTILLGSPKNGTINLIFSPPVHRVEGYVTSSSVTTMTAFDQQGQIINAAETLGRNLADQQSDYEPNISLSVQATGTTAIHCVRIRCGGGQLALADLSFSRVHH